MNLIDRLNSEARVAGSYGFRDEARLYIDAAEEIARLREALKDAYPHIANELMRARIGAAIARAEGI
jgi:hypothetical protein